VCYPKNGEWGNINGQSSFKEKNFWLLTGCLFSNGFRIQKSQRWKVSYQCSLNFQQRDFLLLIISLSDPGSLIISSSTPYLDTATVRPAWSDTVTIRPQKHLDFVTFDAKSGWTFRSPQNCTVRLTKSCKVLTHKSALKKDIAILCPDWSGGTVRIHDTQPMLMGKRHHSTWPNSTNPWVSWRCALTLLYSELG
jgi:hypothetical protein